jgi:hypothetical protein
MVVVFLGVISIQLSSNPIHMADVQKKNIVDNSLEPTKANTNSICPRSQPYPLASEFNRSLSLIEQRFEQNPQTQPLANIVKATRNCLYITYANDEDMQGAEGLFLFDQNSTKDKLNILVSNRYQAKDDILTAILLTHELTHAFFYATGRDANITCFENEGKAFANEFVFISNALNQEEKNSLIARYTNYPSQEIRDTTHLVLAIDKYQGETIFDQATNMVKASSFYQKQCGLNTKVISDPVPVAKCQDGTEDYSWLNPCSGHGGVR